MKSVIYCIISSFIAFYLFCIYIFDNSLIFTLLPVINTFKFHVSCTDGKISVRIKLELPFSPSSHSIVLFENVVITTKGLQERKTTIELDGGE